MNILFLLPLLTAFFNRIRGGLFGLQIKKFIPFWDDTITRNLMGLVLMIPSFFVNPLLGLAGVFLIFLGYILRWSPWQQADSIYNVICMSIRGLILTVPAGFLLHNLIFMGSGLLMGPLYWLGWFIPYTTELDGSPATNVSRAEWLFGFILGLAIISSKFLGKLWY